MNFNEICSFIVKLMKEHFTGKIVLNFHQGHISKNFEKI